MSKARCASGETQAVALLVVVVERLDRIARGIVGNTSEAIDAAAQIATALEPLVRQARGRSDVADAKTLLIGVIGDNERGIFAPRKFGPPDRDMLGIEK